MPSRHCLLFLSLLLSGCSGLAAAFTGRPVVQEGPDYALASESADFADADLQERFGCSELRSRTDFLGGLSPAQALAECLHYNIPNLPQDSAPDDRPKLDRGGLTLRYSTYLLKSEGEIRELGTLGALRQTFAPIESPAEALSLTLASLPGLQRLTATALPSDARKVEQIGMPGQAGLPSTDRQVAYRLDALSGTQVAARGEDFVISNLLFDGDCNGHDSTTVAYSVDYLVTRAGQISEQGRRPVYQLGPCPVE